MQGEFNFLEILAAHQLKSFLYKLKKKLQDQHCITKSWQKFVFPIKKEALCVIGIILFELTLQNTYNML